MLVHFRDSTALSGDRHNTQGIITHTQSTYQPHWDSTVTCTAEVLHFQLLFPPSYYTSCSVSPSQTCNIHSLFPTAITDLSSMDVVSNGLKILQTDHLISISVMALRGLACSWQALRSLLQVCRTGFSFRNTLQTTRHSLYRKKTYKESTGIITCMHIHTQAQPIGLHTPYLTCVWLSAGSEGQAKKDSLRDPASIAWWLQELHY